MTKPDDPLQLDPLVERLAQEAWERANRARGAMNGDAKQQSSILCQFTRELVAVVAEECAKMCDASADRWKTTDPDGRAPVGGWIASGAWDCAEEIRARFSPVR
jgi:hypothetical protein